MICRKCGKNNSFLGDICPYCEHPKAADQIMVVLACLLGCGFGYIMGRLWGVWGSLGGFVGGLVLAVIIAAKADKKS